MRNSILVLLGVLALILGGGCGKKEEPKDRTTGSSTVSRADDDLTEADRQTPLFYDPVAGKYLVAEQSVATYTYEGVEYMFFTTENYEAFKSDPTRYLESRN